MTPDISFFAKSPSLEINNEIETFVEYIKRLHLNLNQHTEELEYKNAVLILVDAVLSMNRKYDSFVVPRIKLIKATKIETLDELKEKIKTETVQGFCKIWQYNHVSRVITLEHLVNKFLQIKKDLKISNDLDALHLWGKSSSVDDFKSFNVSGIGFTTFQYIRLMCGADTIKPDIYLKRSVKGAVGRAVTEAETVQIVEGAAKQLAISARQLDYAIWKYYSEMSRFSSIK